MATSPSLATVTADRPKDPLSDTTEVLEQLLAEALEARETDGDAGLQRFLGQHPEHARELVRALSDLQRLQLLDQPTPALPERFGEFVVERQLGAGGMGVVYVARQESLGRRVALKIVRPELLMFDRAQQRFQREIDAIARIDHPAIVPILATGTAAGVSYYAMPLLDGRNGMQAIAALRGRDPSQLTGADLRQALGGGITDRDPDEVFGDGYWQAAVRLLRKAAYGIQHAHERDVLHRDLKPSNVMLTPDGRAVVLDFGLSHTRSDDQLTQSGATAGSPAYMAPEVLRGEPADERTDVYGLAITLFTLLTLDSPFSTTDTEELRRRILTGERQSLRHRRDLPPELRVVLACGMERDRLRRYPTPQAFADDLTAVLERRPIAARRLPTSVRARRFVQRHQALASTTLVALLSCFGLFVSLYVYQRDANAALREQTERSDHSVRVSMQAVRRLLAGLTSDRLHNAAALDTAHDMLVDARQLLAQLREDAVHRDEARLLHQTVTLKLVVVLGRLGRMADAEQLACEAIADEGDPRSNQRQALLSGTFRARLSAIHCARAEFGQAGDVLADARRLLTPLLQTSSANDAAKELRSVETDASRIAGAEGDVEAAEAALRRAIELAEMVTPPSDEPGTFPLTRSVAQLNLVRFLKRHGRLDEAARANDELLDGLVGHTADARRWPTPDYVRAMALNERSSLMQHQRRDDDAIAVARDALPLLDRLVQKHPLTPEVPKLRAGVRANLGLLWMRKNRFDEARPLVEGGIADIELALQANPQDAESPRLLAHNLRLLGAMLLAAKDWDALEKNQLRLGELPLEPKWRAWAASVLLDVPCQGERRARNCEVALDWLEHAVAAGHVLRHENPNFDAIRDDARFQKLIRTR
jgi:serine/threonine protein kinase